MENLNIQVSERTGTRESLRNQVPRTKGKPLPSANFKGFFILSSFQPRFSIQGETEPAWLNMGHLPSLWKWKEYLE